MDISKGRYWDKPLSLVDGCTPCSPGCDHCWSAVMTHRFNFQWTREGKPEFNGHITTRHERLDIPLKRRKPTVYAVWNDLFHEDVSQTFIGRALSKMLEVPRHTFLVLTKRPNRMADLISLFYAKIEEKSLRQAVNVWSGLTVVNQQETDEKIPSFLQVPGKKFLSIEPMLKPIKLSNYGTGASIDAVILGGETGPGARPMCLDWVRSVRDQCAVANVPFFFKQWGEWAPNCLCATKKAHPIAIRPAPGRLGGMFKCGKKNAGRLLDGRTHDDLPWRNDAQIENSKKGDRCFVNTNAKR